MLLTKYAEIQSDFHIAVNVLMAAQRLGVTHCDPNAEAGGKK
jgi:hypothetical protein